MTPPTSERTARVETSQQNRLKHFKSAHPAFAAELADPLVAAAVCRGDRSVDLLARRLGTTPCLIRTLSRVRPEVMSLAAAATYRPAGLTLLGGLASSWCSALVMLSFDGWVSVLKLIELLQKLTGPCVSGGANGIFVPARSQAAFVRTVGSTLRPDGHGLEWMIQAMAAIEGHLGDLSRAMTHELLVPLAAYAKGGFRPHERVAAAQKALLLFGPRKLARVAQRHIDFVVREAVRLRPEVTRRDEPEPPLSHEDWQPLAQPATAPSGLVLRFLTNRSELAHEGARLRHCVASYSHLCREGQSAILSIGRWSGDGAAWRDWCPSSTVEICRSARQVNGLQVSQHRAFQNALPPKDDAAALAWWLEAVRLQTHGVKLERQLVDAPRPDKPDDLLFVVEQGWNEPEAHARQWAKWKRLLDVRAATLADWLAGLPPCFAASGFLEGSLREEAALLQQAIDARGRAFRRA